MGVALLKPVYDNTRPPPLLRAAPSIIYRDGFFWGTEGLSSYTILLEFELPRYRAFLSPGVSSREPLLEKSSLILRMEFFEYSSDVNLGNIYLE